MCKNQEVEAQIKSLIGEKELREYRNFAFKDDMLKLSVGIILGNSFNKVVHGISDYLVMPIFTFLVSKTGDGWRNWTFTPVKGLNFELGHLFGVFFDFLLISMLLYVFYIKLIGQIVNREVPSLKNCPHCCGRINAAARKCPLCTGDMIVEGDPIVKTRRTRSKDTRAKNRRGK